MDRTVEYATIAVYLLLLLGLGAVLSRANRNLGDYVRGGAQGTWWLVGSSAFMSSISAYTFTANGGLAFEAGPTPLLIFLAICSGLVVAAAFMGPWLRQTRAMTFMDIVRERFGPEVEQFSLYFGLITAPIASSIQLWALAYFCSSVFGLNLIAMILVLGSVVVAYSTTGGRWAVMGTDFLQSLILVPMALLVAFLCIREFGGLDATLDAFSRPDVASDFKWINSPGEFAADKFSFKWVAAMFCISFFNEISFSQAPKYLSVKDGREARKSALLSLVLMAFGGLIFLFPAMTSRLLFADQVMAMSIENPTQTAYAVAAQNVLPNGLVGVLVVAMFAATMSSMDTGLNAATGGIVNNLVPPLRRRLHLPPLEGDAQLRLCRWVTLLFGAVIIAYALLWTMGQIDIFGAFTWLMTLVAIPLSFPFVLSFFIRRLPRWSYFFMVGCAMLPNLIHKLFDLQWSFQDRVFWIFGSCLAAAIISCPFYRFSSEEYRTRVEAMFRRMRTPIDYGQEVGRTRDRMQLRLMSRSALFGGCLLLLLLLVPNGLFGRLCIMFLACSVILVGASLGRAARTRKAREEYEDEVN